MAYTRVTLSDLIARLSERLGPNTNFWTYQEKRDAINESLAVWQALVGEWVVKAELVANGDSFQTTPHQVVSINRLKYNNVPLNMLSLFELDMGYPGWRNLSGTPYYWAPDALDKFAVSPAPSAGAFQIEGYAEPIVLTSNNSFIDLGDEELLRILDYAQFYCAFKEGVKEASDNVEGLKSQHMEAAGKRNARLRKSTMYREFMGRQREEAERPSRAKVQKIGVRTEGGDQ